MAAVWLGCLASPARGDPPVEPDHPTEPATAGEPNGDGEGGGDAPPEGDDRPWFPGNQTKAPPAPAPPAPDHPWFEDQDEDEPPPPRSGFYVLFGVGGGLVSGVDGETAPIPSVDGQIGLLLRPDFGIAADIFGASRSHSFLGTNDYLVYSIGASATFWFSPRLRGSAGLCAIGLHRPPSEETPASESGGFGLHAGLGFEILRTKKRTSALTIQLRVFSGVPNHDDGFGGAVLALGGAFFGLEASD